MKRKLFIAGVVLISCHLFTVCALVFASGAGLVKTQGIIMEVDNYKKTLVVNEKSYAWNQSTATYDAKGSPVTIVKFEPKTWVYIIGERDQDSKLTIINKIYFLPKPISKKEKHLHPFME